MRLRLGLNPDSFEWPLDPGAAFTSPEAITVHSTAGLGDMSETFHRLFRTRLARGEWRDRSRPVLLNNWEGTYFDFDEERLVDIATVARDLGVELFVLDDGWFGVRDSDDRSLGDWVVDTRKLPNGSTGLVERITALGIDFGIWIEPEMVNANSDLFRAHPDWAIGVPGRPRTESRQQLVLDMGRAEVVDYLYDALEAVLGSAPISYVKWDMNRTMTETYGLGLPPERQGEMRHRYILGLYQLYSRLTARFPHILFESCSSGGGRFDAGMLAYAPQAWTSDDTDAMERLRIQWGTSLAFPVSSMGAHVSAVPNHQVARITPLATRAAVAFFGAFGYELDPVTMGPDERAAGRGADRVVQDASRDHPVSAASCGCAARSRATATTRPGCASRTTLATRSSAGIGSCRGRCRVRVPCGCVASIRPRDTGCGSGRTWMTRSSAATPSCVAATS